MEGKQNPRAVNQDRFGVNEMVYFQSQRVGQEAYPSTYSVVCTSRDESPYKRPIRVTEEWQPLDMGWFKEGIPIGELMIYNDEGKLLQRIPTEQERTEIAGRILEVGLVDSTATVIPWCKVHPGRSCRYSPQENIRVSVRSRKGVVRATVVILPG